MEVADLAFAMHVNEDALYRTLRFLAGQGVFREVQPRIFVNSPLSEFMRTDVPGSIRSVLIFRGSQYYFSPFTEFLYSVETGVPARRKTLGKRHSITCALNPEEGRVFDDAMTAISALWAPAIAAAYDFGRWGTVTDVGGGNGLLLAEILRHPSRASWRSGRRSAGARARPPARSAVGQPGGSCAVRTVELF